MMTATKKVTYKATFQEGIAGAVLQKVTRGGRRLDLNSLPQEVIQYLCVERENEAAPWLFADGDFDKLVACGEVKERKRKNAPRQATAEFTVERTKPSSGCAEELPRTWNDGAHCGLTDWYPELEAAITAALARGKGYAWTSGWYSSKKEIASACISQRGGEITVEVSVSDDLDTAGRGGQTIRFTQNLDRIRDAVTAAWREAQCDSRDNRVYAGFSVGRGDRWEYTIILPVGDGHLMDCPPGDNYHRWGWQEVEGGEDRPAEIPAKVAASLLRWAEDPLHEAGMKKTAGGWTIKAWEDDSDA
jgi:hypothetical protein